MSEIMVSRHKLVSVTSIFGFDIDVQKPNVSYMVHGLPGDHDQTR